MSMSNTTRSGGAAGPPGKKPLAGPQMKKIDAGYYFRNIDPAQVNNVIKNFYQELADGRKRFKEILL